MPDILNTFKGLFADRNDGLGLNEFDVESDIVFSKDLGVRSVPVMKFFKDGKDVNTTVGLKTSDIITQLINEHLN